MTSAATYGLTSEAILTAKHAIHDLVPDEATFAKFHLLGTQVVLAYRIDAEEMRRRCGVGCSSIQSSDQLETLMSLPIGMPVPVHVLMPREQRRIDRLCKGAVSRIGGDVVREAVRPLRVDLAVVPAKSWRTGLELAGRFAPFAARIMWLPRTPSDQDDMRAAARKFGVGVAVNNLGGRAEMILDPAPHVHRRHTVAAWQFTEQAFEQALRWPEPLPPA
ncbi:hypothetical protein [Catelliglobosispora koreensis]|uniref:hypothetical protein n=1 Tax=Catelliglobosispora koreensis TaxID=129052 RepID=UPI0012FBB91C|nr:hypothetical protein [Catelliglobosispora koreensis]